MGVLEFEYPVKGMTVDRAMKVCLVSDKLATIVLPQFFAKCERLVGDGNVGSTRLVTLGPAVPDAAGTTMKEEVTVWDESTGTYTYQNVDDPHFSKFQCTLKFSPGADGADGSASTLIKWQLEYVPRDPAFPAPEGVKLVSLEVMKAFEKYCLEHPDFP